MLNRATGPPTRHNIGDQVYAIRRDRDADGPGLAVVFTDVKTGSEKLLASLNLLAGLVVINGYSPHPDGKRIAATMDRSHNDLWMPEGFEPEKPWLDRLLRR